MRESPREDEPASVSTDPLAETQDGSDSDRALGLPKASSEADTRAFADGTTDESSDSGAAPMTGGVGSYASGDRIGRYRLVSALGLGGMGLVFLAHDDELDRPVALKVLRPGGTGDPRRLLREARSMARLAHPHIAAVYDVGTHGVDVYVAMEYVEGPTLRAWMKSPHTWAARHNVLLQAARGLSAAHASGVTHRDFKPENVIVGHDGRVRVLDFGLAKLAPRTATRTDDTTDTQIGAIVGTPRYMAPEQLRGQGAGPSADQFAFCVCAYELAYGVRPFDGEVFADVAASVLTQAPREPSRVDEVPEGLWPMLRRGLRVAQDERYPSMQALTEALEQVAGAPEPARSPPSPALALALAPVVSRPALRDAREGARAQLTQAYADDLLDAEELDSRLERLENAADLPVVAALVADLASDSPAPAPDVAAAPEQALAVPAATTLAVSHHVPGVGRTVAVFSGNRRAGVWQPARVNHVLAVFGGAEIDLRDVELAPGETEIRVFCMFGGIEITVAPGTRVHLECTAIFGGAEQEDASTQPEPGGPILRVTGVVFFGGVEVRERLPGESGWAARKRRKAAQKQLREAKTKKALPPGR
jgi:serine/threonine protein kinase